MNVFALMMVVVAVVAVPVAWAQPIEFGPTAPLSEDPRSSALEWNSPEVRGTLGQEAPVQGQVYTYEDGDRTLQVYLQPDLAVREDSGTASSRGEHIVKKDSAGASGASGGQPVFRSESGTLMTLPGGVLLVLSADWDETETDAFFVDNGIALDRVSELDYLPNGFFVETKPGFPSLDLANALADQAGVELSSPNWWTEVATR